MAGERLDRASPVQERGRNTRKAILDAAGALIISEGPNSFSLQEVADQAGVPIGSLYHYFAGRPALLRALAETHLETLRSDLIRELEPFASKTADNVNFHRAVKKIITLFEKAYSQDPAFRLVWSASQADATLKQLDLQDTRQNAKIIAGSLECFVPRMKKSNLLSLCILICDSISSAVRLSLALDEKERRSIMAQLRGMITGHLFAARKKFG